MEYLKFSNKTAPSQGPLQDSLDFYSGGLNHWHLGELYKSFTLGKGR